MPKRTFACTYPGCELEVYHRHCVSCGSAYFNKNSYVIFCSVGCSDHDRQWQEESEAEGPVDDGEE